MILGIVGKARSGKDTFCKFLVKEFEEHYNKQFSITAFAEPLKTICQEHFGLTHEQLWGEEKESPTEYIKNEDTVEFWTSREIMQEVGSFYRKIDKDYWVKRLYKCMAAVDDFNIIVSDVRHVNEANSIKVHGGFLIKLYRDVDTNVHNQSHESETSLDDYPIENYDFTINNTGSLEDLKFMACSTASAINNTISFFENIKLGNF